MEKTEFSVGKKRFSLEQMKKTDVRKCAEIYAREASRAYNEKWTVGKAEKKIRESMERVKICLLIKEDKEVIGLLIAEEYYWFDGMHCFGEDILLDGEHQGKGIGSAASKAFEEFLRRRGIVEMEIISKKGSRATRIWKKQGFRESEWKYLEKRLK